MPLTLPYAHLNLRVNPFGEIPLEERGALAIVDVSHLIGPLSRPGFAAQFLGGMGRGKTTHLLALRQHFPDAPYYYFGVGVPIPAIAEAPLLFLDETQRLPRRLRAQLFHRSASFVIGTHMDHSSEFKRACLGYESVRIQGLTVEHLQAIINRRIEWARRGPGPMPRVTPASTQYLLQRFGDDLRSMEAYLYEVFQDLMEVKDVEL
jgi:hypothetical protein